ncbi:MAG TPA: NAD-dependent epimerase/dehydratase family protein [Phycisphaerales bacterium]|nr:NAD-dependent epimerase/dehydratase family protein [Phycisphaerales bacterium]
MTTLASERILVTGAAGFLGRHVVGALERVGVPPLHVFAATRADGDLTDPRQAEALLANAFGGNGPTVLVHVAAYSAGLQANRAHPAKFFYDNLAMGVNLIEGLRRTGLARHCCVVQIGCMTSYPKDAPQPYREESLFAGKPDAEFASYGLAKLALLQMLEAYRLEHGLRSVYLIPTSLYGPGDTLDPARTHACGAMVARFMDAARENLPEVTCWGTGRPTRDFLYIEDAAAGVVRAAEWVLTQTASTPVQAINLGSGAEPSIRELAELAAKHAGYQGRVLWDASKGDGVMRRALDTGKARELLGWEAKTSLDEGLARTIEFFRTVRNEPRTK